MQTQVKAALIVIEAIIVSWIRKNATINISMPKLRESRKLEWYQETHAVLNYIPTNQIIKWNVTITRGTKCEVKYKIFFLQFLVLCMYETLESCKITYWAFRIHVKQMGSNKRSCKSVTPWATYTTGYRQQRCCSQEILLRVRK
jgi:hypothetical protein